MRSLVIGDHLAKSKAVQSALNNSGFVCDIARLENGKLEIGRCCNYDIIILERGVSGIGSFDLLRSLRRAHNGTPVLVLSDLNYPEDKVSYLAGGADDYLSRPYKNPEMIARIEAIVRRTKRRPASIIGYRNLRINLDSQMVSACGKPIRLTAREYGVLELLGKNFGSPLTREKISVALNNGLSEPKPNSVDVFVGGLRKKLARATDGDIQIDAVRGRGFILSNAEEKTHSQPI